MEGGEVPKTEVLDDQDRELLSKLEGVGTISDKSMETKSPGSISSKDMIFRADKIDLKSLDVQLEKHLSRVWSSNLEKQNNRPKEVWEIDPLKLEIRYLVAKGTYGTVYRGTYDNQDVAVKLLDWGEDGMATAAETAALRASFRQEVAVWHKLDHPNVTKFVGASMGTSNLKIPSKNPSEGYSTLPSRACCVLVEFLPGGTLKNYLYKNRKRKLAFKIVIQLALDLSRGLSYLHSKKIVHRDVKAENMLLDTNRNLKIADFGVARVEAQNPKDMTGETGTLGYMAPEVLDGKPYNRKCDVYSFGICLWEIYCCDLPYPDLSFAEVSSAVVRQVCVANHAIACFCQFIHVSPELHLKEEKTRPSCLTKDSNVYMLLLFPFLLIYNYIYIASQELRCYLRLSWYPPIWIKITNKFPFYVQEYNFSITVILRKGSCGFLAFVLYSARLFSDSF